MAGMTSKEHKAKQRADRKAQRAHPSDCARCAPGAPDHTYLPLSGWDQS